MDRPVLEAVPWVKCPTKAKHARNIHDYGKTIITSDRSHSSPAPAVRTGSAARTVPPGWATPGSSAALAAWAAPPAQGIPAAAPAPGGRVGTARGPGVRFRGAPPQRSGSGAACRVEASATGEPEALRLGRGASATAGTAVAVTTAARARRGVRPTARLVARQSGAGLTRGSGVSLPARGALWGACDFARAALCHGFRRGQEAYSASDETGVRRPSWPPLLSRCESLTGALDLLSATVRNLSYVKSNLFKFVMT
jgi:hypothetical protein